MNQTPVLSFEPYLDILYRHRVSAVCALVVAVGTTLAALFILPNVYRSTTVVLVQPQAVAPAFVAAPAPTDVLNRVKLLTEEALSRVRLEELIRRLNLYPHQRAAGEAMDMIVERMRRHIVVDLNNENSDSSRLNSFSISFEYPVAELAQKGAARLADIYVNEDLQERSAQAEAASEFLRDQAVNAQAKLEGKADEIKSYKTRYRASLPEQLENNLKQLDRLQEQLSGLNDTVAETRQVSPETRLTQLETQLTTMRARYSDAYPDVVDLRAEVDALKKSQRSADAAASAERKDSAAESLHLLEAQRAGLRRQIEDYRQRIAQAPLREQELSVLDRDYEVLSKDYEQLLHKQLDAQVSARLEQRQEGERLRILDTANFPIKPERPNRAAIAILGLAFSVLGAIGLPFALFYTDTSFKAPDELAREYGLPVLVAIPPVGDGTGRSTRAVLRAAAASCITLSTAVAALWVYAARFF